MFDNLIVSSGAQPHRHRRVLAVSLALHGSVVFALLTVPLLCYQKLPGTELVTGIFSIHLPDLPPPSPPPVPIDPVPTRPAPASATHVVRLPDTMVPPPSLVPAVPGLAPLPATIPYLGEANGFSSPPSGIVGGAPGIPRDWVVPTPTEPPPPLRPIKEPQHVSSGVQAARLIRRVEPVYPDLARKARIEGAVMLQVRVDEEGNVADVEVLSGPALLRDAAVAAIQQWKYSPTILNGEPYPVLANVTVRFVLE